MSRFAWWWIALSLSGALDAAEPLAPANWKLPPIDGELSGDLALQALATAPPLHWSMKVRTDKPRERVVELDVTAPGVQVHLNALLDPFGNGTWQVNGTDLALGEWWSVLKPFLSGKIAEGSAEGILSVNGRGTLQSGALAGAMGLEMREGAFHDAGNTWSVTGVTLAAHLAELPAIATREPVRVTFHEITASGIALRDGAVEFLIEPDRTVRILGARGNLMNGRIELSPFAIRPRQSRVTTTLHFESVELSGMARFLPSVLAEATGPVSGQVEVSWDLNEGLKLANGSLQPRPLESASIKLAPSPGFLTSRLPERVREKIDLLPTWLGPIRKLFMPKNPAYETLRAIEMGEMALEVKTLVVEVNPEGDVSGRTARVVVMARPTAAGSAVDSVRFEINVSGPLADLVRLGLEGRLKVHAH
jgi:hypothetical protein